VRIPASSRRYRRGHRRARAGTRRLTCAARRFLPALRRRCDDAGALLVVDAIFTGLGRLGELWPGSDVADVFVRRQGARRRLPLSAALFVRRELEDVWKLGVEDVYTHTHTGNPLACAGALVVLEEVPKLLPRVASSRDASTRRLGGRAAADLGGDANERAARAACS
jgi:4-aminobutyrate aminotransferase-like enzyme